MKWFKPGRTKKKKVAVIGIDGVPYSLLIRLIREGKLPGLARLLKAGNLRRINSTIPTVSGVAWSSFMTGKNPGKHGIFGFVDRTLNPFRIYIPTAKNMKAETLWEILSAAGKRVVVINVPVTYPPRKVNGILISGFLASDLQKGVYPESLYPKLERIGYRIDIDSWQARESKDELVKDLNATFTARTEAALYLLKAMEWDFFILHIMETDRLHHFLWEDMEKQRNPYAEEFLRFYQRIDKFLGTLSSRIGDEVTLIILSDHGFCGVKAEIQLNYFLEEKGLLKFKRIPPRSLTDLDGSTLAYSLIPGRIYLNVRGREPEGRVEAGNEYEARRNELIISLSEWADPETGEEIFEKVYRREEIYTGPELDGAADLVAVPREGFDLKGKLKSDSLYSSSPLNGMHTFADAFLYVRGEKLTEEERSIIDPASLILGKMGVPQPKDMDARSVLA